MNKDLAQLLKEVRNQGFTVEPVKRGHRVTHPKTGESTTVFSDSSARRIVANTTAELCDIGFIDPRKPPKPKERRDETPAATAKGHNDHHQVDQPSADDTTPEDTHMATTTQTDTSDNVLDPILKDLPTNVWLVCHRVRELAEANNGQHKTLHIDGEDCDGVVWTGSLDQVIFELFPTIKGIGDDQRAKFKVAFVPHLRDAGLRVLTSSQASPSGEVTWWVRSEESTPAAAPAATFMEPGQAAEPKTPAAAPAAPDPAKEDTTMQVHSCDSCCFVADRASSLRTHNQRSGAVHEEDQGAPHRCTDALAAVTNGRHQCVWVTGTREALINHIRRAHTELAKGLQFCRVPDCMAVMPDSRAELVEHNLKEHGRTLNKKRPADATPAPAPQAAPRPQPPLRTRDRVTAPEPASQPETELVGTIPAKPATESAELQPVTGNGAMNPEVAAQAVKTIIEQYQAAIANNTRLSADLDAARTDVAAVTKERDALREQVKDLEFAREGSTGEAEELREKVAKLQKELEAFASIRQGLGVLMSGGQ